jgi:hypothetical protein
VGGGGSSWPAAAAAAAKRSAGRKRGHVRKDLVQGEMGLNDGWGWGEWGAQVATGPAAAAAVEKFP